MPVASDESPLTDAEIEAALGDGFTWNEGTDAAPAADVSRETPRRPGRPKGARNKPKPATPGAPASRPARTPRKPAVRKPDYARKIQGTVELVGAGVTLASATLHSEPLAADALTLMHYAAGIGNALGPLAEKYPGFGAVIDNLDSAGPAAMVLAVGMPLILQLAVNHGLMAPLESMGVVSRETMLGTAPVSRETSAPA